MESEPVASGDGTAPIGFSASPESIALRRLLDASAASDREMSRRLHLRPMDMTAMNIITSTGPTIGPRELSQRLGITPAAATELVDRLEGAGHIVRSREGDDRRRVQLNPTPSALREVESHLRGLIHNLDVVSAGFSESERGTISEYLARVTAEFRRFAENR